LPAFLKLDYEKDLRIDRIMETGNGNMFLGIILNTETRMKIGVLADSIVIKKLQNRDILSPQKNIDSFYQEVAVMAFASFLFFFFFQLTSSKFINLFRTLLFHPYVCQLLGYSENPNCIVMPKYEVINNTEHEKPKIKSNHNPPIFTI